MAHFTSDDRSTVHRMTEVVAFVAATLLSACTYSTGSFDEPGLRGKLIDAETSQPVQGAVVYGYYATAAGSLGGGETIKEILRLFEVESNAEGIFEVPAWKISWSIKSGEPRQRFPAIAIYKDGYKLDLQNLSTIADWVSQTKLPGEPTRTGNVIDWTAVPVQLKSTKTERERYDALNNSNYGYAAIGECGWEQHVKLLVAQHWAWKGWLKRNVPAEGLDADGYTRSGYGHPDVDLRSRISHRSTVDNILHASSSQRATKKCIDPRTLFGLKQ